MTTPTRRTARGQSIDVQERLTLLERRLARGFGARPWQDWAIKSGPTSCASDYLNVWARGLDSGGSLDSTMFPGGILVKEAGEYDILAQQRGANDVTLSDTGYISLGINGSRSALEGRADGVFSHDHTGTPSGFTSSAYIGFLPAGSIITAGPTSALASRLLYAAPTYIGTLKIRRIS